MAAFGQNPLDPQEMMRRVQPRTGFPVQNQGGIPRTPTSAPPKPFVTAPTVAQGPPGPAPAPGVQTGRVAAAIPQLSSGQPPSSAIPAPAPGVPAAAPAPPAASASPAPTPASSSVSTGSIGSAYAPMSPPAQDSLEQQIRAYLTPALAGETVSKGFIDRAKGDVFRTVSGQTAQAKQQIDDDAVRRGLFRSGIPAESYANVLGQSKGAIARGVADILNSAEAQNIQGKQQAGSQALSLLGGNRDWQSYWQNRQDDLQREADARAGRGGGGPTTFEYIDPDTGQQYTLDESWF